MYLQFYGLRDIPFSLTPDPRFIYFTASHREVMANLSYGIQYGKGLIVTTGEVGTGKTMMLRAMLTKLDRSVLCSYIFNPGLTVSDLYQQIGADFGLGQYTSKSDMLMKLGKMLMMRHSRGLRTVLIVDESQGLSRELLEEIRLLLNFETYSEKQLQIIMVGQPELRQLLNSPDLRQLKQRISLRCEIKPLKADEVSAYIRTRLKVAGASRLNLFTADAIAMIFRASEGIPRLVNNICDNALLAGYGMNAKTITPAIVSEVAEALDLLSPMIEDDPRVVMESSPLTLPVMIENADENPLPRLQDPMKTEAPPQRRRSNAGARRRKSGRQDVSLLRQDQIENMRLKVISVTDGDHDVEDEVKAG
ncbi:MAG TPA: AAA family ATPase [Blastocatellia bacterium]|nr:AAA family ATPase [Blastocatellia bacterium]